MGDPAAIVSLRDGETIKVKLAFGRGGGVVGLGTDQHNHSHNFPKQVFDLMRHQISN